MTLQVLVLRALVPREIHPAVVSPYVLFSPLSQSPQKKTLYISSVVATYWTYESSEEIKMLEHPFNGRAEF